MPTVKDKTTGDVVSQQPYTSEGTQRAKQIADTDPNWELSYAPNGKTDGAMRSQKMYAGGGKVGYDSIGGYKKGGKVNYDYNPRPEQPPGDGPHPKGLSDWELTQEPVKPYPEYKKGGKVKK